MPTIPGDTEVPLLKQILAAVQAGGGGGTPGLPSVIAANPDATGMINVPGLPPKDARNQAAAPTVNDDSTLGYAVGSRWYMTNGSTYYCTGVAVGAAVWAIANYTLASDGKLTFSNGFYIYLNAP